MASPYSDGGVEERLADESREVDLVGLNCLGYDAPLEAAVARATGKPVVLARRALAEAVARTVTVSD
ncbi:MAG: AroM family protein [Bryobacterales bacterium]|nr:AroM family protein [Bryobacterales bacterium]